MKRYRKLSPLAVRRLVSLAVVLGVCALLLPLSIPLISHKTLEKDDSQPFPCQNRPCGCRSAEQCWKKCCCFNNTQKIAWAKAHNVKVPSYVLAAAARDTLNKSEICSLPSNNAVSSVAVSEKATCSHCKPNARSSIVALAKVKTSSTSPCRSNSAAGSTRKPSASSATAAPEESSRWVMAVFSAECQGQGPHVFCSVVLMVPCWRSLLLELPQLVEPFSIESDRMHAASLRPPVPPPKIGAACFFA